ncbi:MAG: hypothetical protein KDE15_01080 [Erythrobacter sp.]|nr:hypothetical protein [Erythrobacter sp.]
MLRRQVVPGTVGAQPTARPTGRPQVPRSPQGGANSTEDDPAEAGSK